MKIMFSIKKLVSAMLFSCVLLSVGGCKPMEKSVKAIEGKEGIFAVISTAKGDIVLELFYKQTPLTVTNFVGLAEGTLSAANGKPFYDGLKFHRVISRGNGDSQDFMIQGGDPRGNGTGGPGYKFSDEFVDSLKFTEPGLLAMANSGPATNGSQFFVTIVPTEWLNGHHTIFGKVVDAESLKVVNKIKQNDVMTSVRIYRQGAEAEKFTATQADFDRLEVQAKKNALAAKEKANAAKIAAVEKAFPGFNKDENGIYWKTTKAGSGEKCGRGKSVTTEYKGYLVDGTLFDGSEKFVPGSHEALNFTTAGGQMIPGFDVMVQDMKKGEVRTIVIPSDMAYGDRGIPQAGIEGGAYIAFDIELVEVR